MGYILVFALCIRICTDLCFKGAVNTVEFRSVLSFFQDFRGLLLKPIFWLAIGLGLFNFWLWCLVLSYFELSYAYPFFSVCFVFIMLGGKVFFDESLDRYKTSGMFCILFAAVLLGMG